MNGGRPVARDQAVGLGARYRRVALHVGDDQVELGAAQRLDAAGIVDHLHGQFRCIDAALADLREAAGDRVKSADSDGIRRRSSTDAKCGDRAGGERTAGFDQEISAANPFRSAPSRSTALRGALTFGLFHLILPELAVRRVPAPALLSCPFYHFPALAE